jgi:hypothetical protein
MIKEI